jgi:flagellar basal body-associated protein FliL
MAKNFRTLIIALVVVVIAVLVATFSLSLFTSSSASPGNVTTSGIMTQDDSEDGSAILTAEKLLPGQSGEGTVSITNVGDSAGDVRLTSSNLVDDPADPPFSAVLTLVVSDSGAEYYNGLISDFDGVDLGTWRADETHDFTFTVTFAAGSGNEYQDATTTLDFTWDAEQST